MKGVLATLAFVLILGPPPARAAEPLDGIYQRLALYSTVCADFVQTKTLRALSRPLESRGRMVFVTGKGLLWQGRRPFPSQLLVKRDSLIKWDEAGELQRVAFGQAPVFQTLSTVFFSVFTGDVARLGEVFDVTPMLGEQSWHMRLIPRDEAIAKIIATIDITGAQFVDMLEIAEGRGDRTVIEFEYVNGTTCHLDDAESIYFRQ